MKKFHWAKSVQIRSFFCGKIRTRKNSVFGHFSHSVWLVCFNLKMQFFHSSIFCTVIDCSWCLIFDKKAEQLCKTTVFLTAMSPLFTASMIWQKSFLRSGNLFLFILYEYDREFLNGLNYSKWYTWWIWWKIWFMPDVSFKMFGYLVR